MWSGFCEYNESGIIVIGGNLWWFKGGIDLNLSKFLGW